MKGKYATTNFTMKMAITMWVSRGVCVYCECVCVVSVCVVSVRVVSVRVASVCCVYLCGVKDKIFIQTSNLIKK